ncbi:MAG: hypothetical protein ACPL4K_03530 [Candidatus Margulisiibacteriota bacterium]
MAQEHTNKNQYDVVSVSRLGSEKRANYIQDALKINQKAAASSAGQFVKVFADIFLKQQAGKRSYV